MYITLFHEDIDTHILTMNFLRSNNVEFIMKGKYFFLKQETYELIKQKYQNVYLQHYESADSEVKYHLLANKVESAPKRVSHIFEGYIPKGFTSEDSYTIPESRTVFFGGLVGLYFKGELISNPLDVLWKIATTWPFQQKYKAVFYDFIPAGKQIMYMVFFEFTGNDFGAKIAEILNTKIGIESSPLRGMIQSGFPQIYKDFQSSYLSKHSPAENYQLNFVDSVVYLPTTDAQIERVREVIREEQ